MGQYDLSQCSIGQYDLSQCSMGQYDPNQCSMVEALVNITFVGILHL